jgi:hypothetical protein
MTFSESGSAGKANPNTAQTANTTNVLAPRSVRGHAHGRQPGGSASWPLTLTGRAIVCRHRQIHRPARAARSLGGSPHRRHRKPKRRARAAATRLVGTGPENYGHAGLCLTKVIYETIISGTDAGAEPARFECWRDDPT